MDIVKGVLWHLQGDLETEILFLYVCMSSFLNHVSGRGEISAGKSLEAFYSTQQMAVSRDPTPEQKFRIICLTPCSYANS